LKIPKGGNQNPYIKDEQTTQREKVQKDLQRPTKHYSLISGDNIKIRGKQYCRFAFKPIIIMIKRKLSSDGQQFHQFQQSKRKLSSDGQQYCLFFCPYSFGHCSVCFFGVA
jgi:hypothetical protein